MTEPGLRVEIDGLELRYGEARVLAGIDLRIAPGERLCLVGPNGAGKSSLLRCLSGLAEPTRGQVRLDAVPLGEIERSMLARTISVVPSQVELPFSMPADRGRLLDYLNAAPPFLRLEKGGRRWLVNRDAIQELSEVDG